MREACTRFEARLDAFVAGSLPSAQQRELQEHVHGCARCAELLAVVQGSAMPELTETLVEQVLGATSGTACQSVQAMLCDFVDAVLPRDDGTLVEGHLQHCASCGALARTLVLVRHDLTGLQECPPDAAFVDDVLRATSHAQPASPGWRQRLTEVWNGLLQRPRLAWEVAWVGTAILVLLCGGPRAPLRDVPQSALAIVQTDPVALWHTARTPMERTWGWVRDDVESAWDGSGGRMVQAMTQRRTRWMQQHPQATASWQSLQTRMPTLRQAVADGNLAQASWVLTDMGGDLQDLWRGMRADPVPIPGTPPTREESN